MPLQGHILAGAFCAIFAAGFADGRCPKTETVMGQASVSFFEVLKFEFCILENVNKITVLLTKMRDLQGFCVKKDLADFTLQGQFFYCGFTNWVCPKS